SILCLRQAMHRAIRRAVRVMGVMGVMGVRRLMGGHNHHGQRWWHIPMTIHTRRWEKYFFLITRPIMSAQEPLLPAVIRVLSTRRAIVWRLVAASITFTPTGSSAHAILIRMAAIPVICGQRKGYSPMRTGLIMAGSPTI